MSRSSCNERGAVRQAGPGFGAVGSARDRALARHILGLEGIAPVSPSVSIDDDCMSEHEFSGRCAGCGLGCDALELSSLRSQWRN